MTVGICININLCTSLELFMSYLYVENSRCMMKFDILICTSLELFMYVILMYMLRTHDTLYHSNLLNPNK